MLNNFFTIAKYWSLLEQKNRNEINPTSFAHVDPMKMLMLGQCTADTFYLGKQQQITLVWPSTGRVDSRIFHPFYLFAPRKIHFAQFFKMFRARYYIGFVT
jgi:hypothetical protein